MRTLWLAAWLCLFSSAVHAAELIVSAAASLTNAFREVGKMFEAAHASDRVVFNFASSDVLLAQIAKGAPVDVFATDDTDSMDRAEKQGLLADGTRRALLRNRLVLIVPDGGGMTVSTLTGLEQAAVRRIAIGNPASVPAGRYAREALQQAGLWSRLEPKLILAQNVRQVLDHVAGGKVDAGLVYATDAAIMPDKVNVTDDVPTTTPIVYPIALVKDTRNRSLAEMFVTFLRSKPARDVFARHGFTPL